MDHGSPVKGLVARTGDGAVAGICHYVLHLNTWCVTPVCYLEDLFTDPAHRGRGVGRALIDHLVALGRERGWNRVYWQTHQDNATARRLYDGVAGGNDGFVRYVIRL
ncbi:MAG: GNAT family N-acetyltransferase [Azospirillaceae bacterium]|nr:GNAT family N-acetyltransferase [Azospirillaceae bacterium]